MQKLKIAITGAGGFIGSHLTEVFEREPVSTVLISGAYGNIKHYAEGITVDICDFDHLKEHLLGSDIVIHLAGLNSVRDSFDHPSETLKVNTIGTSTLLSVCKDLGINRIIMISSAEVYGIPSSNSVSESEILKPLSPYGISKVAIEQLCFVYHKAYGMKFQILRPFSIYGPGMSPKSLIKEIYNHVKLKQNISLFNCASTRDYCYVKDLANAIKLSAYNEFRGFNIYNVASGVGINSKQLAELIQSIMQTSGIILESPSPDRPRNTDVNYLVANTEKIALELNWTAQTSMLDGLIKTIHSFERE
ncbi:MAG: NAD-dependent epimerase/dehydratase family protein [Flavobacterium sp.]|nr:MAG: NAD-dependent epimerase/dehydratase family protein [Flavobacterium sp.]